MQLPGGQSLFGGVQQGVDAVSRDTGFLARGLRLREPALLDDHQCRLEAARKRRRADRAVERLPAFRKLGVVHGGCLGEPPGFHDECFGAADGLPPLLPARQPGPRPLGPRGAGWRRNADAWRGNRGEACSDLERAAVAAGDAIKGVAAAAGDEARLGKAQMKSELAEGALATLNAAGALGGATGEQVDALMDKGRDLLDSAAELIRERPLAAFGVAFAAGWIISKLGRSDK